MLKQICLILFCCLGFVLTAYAQNSPLSQNRLPIAQPKVNYGFDREFPPYSFQEPGGKPVGFDVDLVEAIFRGTDVSLQMRPLDWKMILLELASGEIAFTSGMIPTRQRKENYLFSNRPTMGEDIRFFTKNYNRVSHISLLRGQTVSTEKGSYSQRMIEQYGGIIVKTYDTKQSAIRALYEDHVYAYCGLEANTYYILNKLKFSGISAIGTPLRLSEMYFAINKSRPDVQQAINKGMSKIIANGEYETIYRKWFVKKITDAERDTLIENAKKATISAYAPYSDNTRGAAVLTMSGKTYTGSNLENADPKLSISALRSALAQAAADGNMEVRAAVTVDDRGVIQPALAEDMQVMYEFNRGALFILREGENRIVVKMVGALLTNPVIVRPVQALEE